jgi:signal transduction histidine kinase
LERVCNALLELEELHASTASTQPLLVTSLLSDVVNRAERLPGLGGRGITATTDADLTLDAHPHWLEVALDNLVSNAMRYGQGAIEVGARQTDVSGGPPGVELWVRDEGEGMPASFLPRAFERFARVDESRSSGGTGLGLAIVAEIASLHGATVSIDGSRVSLLFPQVKVSGR